MFPICQNKPVGMTFELWERLFQKKKKRRKKGLPLVLVDNFRTDFLSIRLSADISVFLVKW